MAAVGSGAHVVAAGESIQSIAYAHGLHPDAIREHPDNAELKSQRKDPNILLPGDRLVVRALRRKEEIRESEARHKFKLTTRVPKVRIRFLDEEGRGRANAPYRGDIDGRSIDGTLDGEGWLEERVKPDARRGRVVLNPGSGEERVYAVSVGHLDPIEEQSGVAGRLRNLGYLAGGAAGEEALAAALRSYQADQGLEESGTLDAATRDKLKDHHGS